MIISIEEKDNGKILRLKKGEAFQITLLENASTGYTWLEEIVSEKNVVLLEKEDYVGNHTVIGGSGVRAWTYTANEAGQRKVRFHYQRPWLQEAVKSFEITIIVI
ncbi:inhibitor of cysteine peptidase [Paenibacillus sp. RC254]|uniref:protease inhibitor I42 family protein n=1 Tax=unclassified Paenibacillus TaxID=185978 RepID=UPI0024B878C4|nr:protease inhibitor I42 family protein [Paenibacillus sp. RC334]